MKEHGKLFKGDMVRAILDGTKTQTRRPFYTLTKNISTACFDRRYPMPGLPPFDHSWTISNWRNVKVGDRIWVRESLGYDAEYGHFYSAKAPGSLGNASGRTYLCSLFDTDEAKTYSEDPLMPDRSVPSIHLPRRYSRITLEVTEVRVERLQDISEEDARAEGCDCLTWNGKDGPAKLIDWPLMTTDRPWANGYALLWESINGDGSWAANPWVYAVSFRRLP